MPPEQSENDGSDVLRRGWLVCLRPLTENPTHTGLPLGWGQLWPPLSLPVLSVGEYNPHPYRSAATPIILGPSGLPTDTGTTGRPLHVTLQALVLTDPST